MQCTKKKYGSSGPGCHHPTSQKLKVPGTALKCSHVKCNGDKSKRTTVRHSSVEVNGMNHHCLFNKFEKKCHCKCWGARPVYVSRQHGRHNFAAKNGFSGTHCEKVKFAHKFDPAAGPVKVVISTSHFSPTPKWEHDSAITWVEHATGNNFEVCARESKKWWHSFDKHDARMHIEYFAFQGKNKGLYGSPWPGAQGASVKLGERWNSKVTNCHTIKFPKKFDSVPMVLGTIDHQDSKITHDALTFWLEDINQLQYRVCFRETMFNDDWHMPIHFNWIAFEHKNPNLWYRNQMPYSVAGRQASGEWSVYDKKKVNGKTVFLNCKDVNFGKTFQTPPTVLVTANHYKSTGVVDWGITHDATMTYMDDITTKGFKVCATELARHDGKHDPTMNWDWIAFGDHIRAE